MMEMLQSKDVDARVHAFDLLFNLSIHVSLYEEIKLEDNPPDKPPPTTNPPNDTHPYKYIELLQANLYSLLCDMLLCIQDLIPFTNCLMVQIYFTS